jgi:peptidoglycan-associated lipoprotein
MNKAKIIGVALLCVTLVLSMTALTGCGAKQVKEDETTAKPGMTEEERRLREQQEKELIYAQRAEVFQTEMIHFAFDRYDIRTQDYPVLENKAGFLREYPNIYIVIEGHCDNRGTEEYNYALGDRRAKSAKKFLVGLGVDRGRLSTVSYGEERPLPYATGNNEHDWALNRRCEFKIQ